MDQRLVLACSGKSLSQGGMNLLEFKRSLIKLYPENSSNIVYMKREQLQQFCKNNLPIKEEIKKYTDKYFFDDVPLSEKNKKYCNCIIKVANKNKEWCYKHDLWKKGYTKGCVNPYAICTKSTKRKGTVKCFKYINPDALSKSELLSLAKMKGVTTNEFKQIIKKERISN